MENKDKNDMRVEIWGDVVSIKSLVSAIVIVVTSTMLFYAIGGQGDRTRELFSGLLGAVAGFILVSLIIKPKREISVED